VRQDRRVSFRIDDRTLATLEEIALRECVTLSYKIKEILREATRQYTELRERRYPRTSSIMSKSSDVPGSGYGRAETETISGK